MGDYQVKKGVLGRKVLYDCPACKVPLTSSLDKAGINDACPDCGRPHVIPGTKEKTELEQSTASVQRQRLEEETKRKAAEAVAKEAQKRVVKQPIVFTEPSIAPDPPVTFVSETRKKSHVRRRRFGDGILDAAFVLTRGFSVVVILVAVVALLLVAALITFAYSNYRTAKVVPVAIPDTSDFNAFMKRRSQQEKDTSVSSDTTDPQFSETLDRVSAILKKHKLIGTESHNRLLAEKINRLRAKLEPNEFSTFLDAFDQFIGKQQEKFIAVGWFCIEYESNIESRKDAGRLDEFHNAAVTARISLLATSAVTIFGGLISFMILPLLIRIEANTREVS